MPATTNPRAGADAEAIHKLEQSLEDCLRIDRYRFRRKLKSLKKKAPSASHLQALERQIADSCRIRSARQAQQLAISYPSQLPVSQRIDEIRAMVEQHPVIIVCGETGSGKSTQLPKLCLELGRGISGSIAHTQPRRLAARALANRVAEELGGETGDVVGYRVRFDQKLKAETRVQFLTDGLLLAELEGDRFLDAYDTIIIDEAHERSLNIDLLLGHLKGLLKRRPDLRVIVTSATIDPDRFSRFFDNAKVIEVSGRTYPVDLHYRPLVDDKGRELNPDSVQPDVLNQAILDALEEALQNGEGDALVFLPGEREIRSLCEAAAKQFRQRADVLPLFARLERADQDRVFKPASRTRIVVATNVAETSVTVPRIRYVIDAGLARINRYHPGRRIQRLGLEKISQAAADQRKGRCGRVRAGICYRLFSEEDFLSRDEFTDPEILRSSLADVILRLEVLRLGGIEQFRFLDPPDGRRIRDGFRLLEELGAIDADQRITSIGVKLARMPIDVRLGRMLLEASKLQCVSEVIVLTAALSIPDPRIVPADRIEQARTRHRELENPQSDFLTLLDLDRQWSEISGKGTTARRARFCRDNFLSFLRMLEWTDLKRTLTRFARESGLSANEEAASSKSIHRAVLTGMLANVARHEDDGIYLGSHGRKLKVHPSSGLSKRRKGWLVAAEITETHALFARTVAPVQPKWIEQAGSAQVRKSWSNPRWDSRRGSVFADERVTLYGLTLVNRRPVPFASIDPVACRQVFISEALLTGAFQTDDDWCQHNLRMLAEAESLEARFRRRDLRIGDEKLYEFYDKRLPDTVNGRDSFKRWWRKQQAQEPRLLHLRPEDAYDTTSIDPEQRPTSLQSSGLDLKLVYRFEPGADDDGISVELPLSLLNQVDASQFEWLVPGLLREKVIALCRGLPKQLRTRLVPVPDTIDRMIGSIAFGEGDLLQVLSAALAEHKGVHVAQDQWQLDKLEPVHRMHFHLLDENGESLAGSRDLESLRRQYGADARGRFVASGSWEIERTGIRRWDFGDLPERVEKTINGQPVVGFAALVDTGSTCAIKVFDSSEQANEALIHGVRNLLLLQMPAARRQMTRQMPDIDEMCLLYLPLGPCAALREQLIRACIDRALDGQNLAVRSEQVFSTMSASLKTGLMPSLQELCQQVLEVLRYWRDIRMRLDDIAKQLPQQTVTDIKQQLEHLLPAEFVLATPTHWLAELPRFLSGIKLRLEAALSDPRRDLARQAELAECDSACEKYRRAGFPQSDVIEMQWWFEELRISTYAQTLGTTMPISAKRLDREWQRRLSLLTGPSQ